ncbi:MAG: iron-sulfur flavoprotein [candidate division Zixibacteria bacterium RBG_16_43_9]|nr:MAG: iron-sulfur flavoprotein [candidate division Zixibacteria bacterium RBG_16_43_9]
MSKAVAINGSPRKQKGNTAMLLTPLIQGMKDAGYDVELFYARDLKIKSCNCNNMYCWYKKPGICCLKDDMNLLYPRLREAEILILATPVYIPLPGEMQNIINRLCPLIKPLLETRESRTRARFHEDVKIRKILLVSTGGWWEKGNFGTVVRITEELAEDASVEFAGAVIRPHAFLMKKDGKLTKDGQVVIEAARKAGEELAQNGAISQETFEAISRPLISEEELGRIYNDWIKL